METKNTIHWKKGIRGIFWFTLVELIVVIAILAILGTVAFTSLSGFQSSARDSDRITTLKNIDSGLSLFHIQSGSYPMPDPNGSWMVLTGSINGVVYAYLGTIGDSASRIVRISKVPLDPISGQSYVYGVSADRKYYQTAAVLESTEAYNPSRLTPALSFGGEGVFVSPWQGGLRGFSEELIPTVYADSSSLSYQARVNGDYPGYFKFSSGSEVWIANVPSLLWNNTGSVNLLSTGTYFVVNKQTNLPYRLDPASIIQNQDGDRIVQAITGTGTASLTGVNISNVTTSAEVSALFTGSLLASFWGNVSTVQSAVLGSMVASAGAVVPNNCTLSGTTILHGASVTAYSENNIDKFAGYDCVNRQQTRNCNNGVLDGSEEYQYAGCVKWTINTCSASGSYVYNGHTYSIPALSHGSGAVNILSANVSENNGIFKYILSSVTCNDGSYASTNEEASPMVQSCNTGYGVNGNNCSASQNGTCNNTVALGCGIGSAINDNGQSSCGTTRTWNCGGLYGGGSSVQCTYNNGICRWEQQYTTPGSYTWTVPAGVTSVSVVCVGGGGGGGAFPSNPYYNYPIGGGGGGLGWKNSISVTPGQNIPVIVGSGWIGIPWAGYGASPSNWGDSSFDTYVSGLWGKANQFGNAAGGWHTGDWGGNWGSWNGAWYQGNWTGGGAGWYTGNWGAGVGKNIWGQDIAGNSWAGGGGAGGGATSGSNYGGGWVGIYGQGASGIGIIYGGKWGSNWTDADTINAGNYGWGGGAYNYSKAGNGACRIVWPGTTRQFPSTDVGT